MLRQHRRGKSKSLLRVQWQESREPNTQAAVFTSGAIMPLTDGLEENRYSGAVVTVYVVIIIFNFPLLMYGWTKMFLDISPAEL